jgi:hypothetical protein
MRGAGERLKGLSGMAGLRRLGGVTFHHAGAFWFGVVAVTGGVIGHFPMYLMGKDIGYRLVGMPMDMPMKVGMVAIVVGLIASLYGLYPRSAEATARAASRIRVSALDDAPLSFTHVTLLLAMALAVIIDIMKPTALAFVMPGMALEYGLKSPLNPSGSVPVAYIALSGIVGTVIGSFIWGWLGDRIGRRASILYAGIGFIATSICGAMPDFSWNLVMCFLMGLSVGGMLPICYALLAEAIPARHRGWLMILIGADVAGGYIVTSWLAAALVPTYSWRILWLIGLPTGVVFILLNRWIPESPRFLLANGREREARSVMARYGARVVEGAESETAVEAGVKERWIPAADARRGLSCARLGARAVRLQPVDSDESAQARIHAGRRDPSQRGANGLSADLPRGLDVRLLEQPQDDHPAFGADGRLPLRFRPCGRRGGTEPVAPLSAAHRPDLGHQLGGGGVIGLQLGDLSDAHPLARDRLCRRREQSRRCSDHRARRVRNRRALDRDRRPHRRHPDDARRAVHDALRGGDA